MDEQSRKIIIYSIVIISITILTVYMLSSF